jgi:hypothetical protein
VKISNIFKMSYLFGRETCGIDDRSCPRSYLKLNTLYKNANEVKYIFVIRVVWSGMYMFRVDNTYNKFAYISM